MSWSLELRNGDLTLGQASYGTVTQEAKLVQDLRCYILESMGTDDMHPGFGSVLQGGIQPDGTYNPGVVGQMNDPFARTFVLSEIRRLVRNYQATQLERVKNDRATYGTATLTSQEVLLALDKIDVQQIEDRMDITLFITTAANIGLTVNFNLPNA